MMNHTNRKNLLVAVLSGLIMWASPLMAQQYKIDVSKPDYDGLYSPIVDGNTGVKRWKPKEWLEVELKLKIESSDRKETHADRVTVRWYIAAKVTEGTTTKVRVLEKEVDYVNVPLKEDIYVSVYLSPSAIKRISGRDNAAKSILEGVGGEVMVNGSQPVKNSGIFSTLPESKGKWWDSMARYNKIPLRNKNETPFKFLWWDRYAEIEDKR